MHRIDGYRVTQYVTIWRMLHTTVILTINLDCGSVTANWSNSSCIKLRLCSAQRQRQEPDFAHTSRKIVDGRGVPHSTHDTMWDEDVKV